MGDFGSPPYNISDLLSASALVYTGPAFVKRLVVTVAGATSPRIRIYDGTDNGGTLKFDFNPPAISSMVLEFVCQTGIYVEIGGTTPPQCFVAYKKG